MKKQAIVLMSALMALQLTGCANMSNLGFPFSKNETKAVQEETQEATEPKEISEAKETTPASTEATKTGLTGQLKRMFGDTDATAKVETMLKASLEDYAKKDAIFVELVIDGDNYTQTMISACSPEAVVTAVKKESDLLSTEGIALYKKDGNDWIIMIADKGATEDEVAISSMNEQMKSNGYKTYSSTLSGFEVLTLNLADLKLKEVQEKDGKWTAKGNIEMLAADVTVYFDNDGKLSSLEYNRPGESGEYYFYAEGGPNEEKGEFIAGQFLEIAESADNCFSSSISSNNSTEAPSGGYNESTAAPKEVPSSNDEVYQDGVKEAVGAVAGRVRAGDIPGWETNENIQKAINEVKDSIGKVVMDASFGCSWLEFEDSQKRYAPGEAVWVPSALLAFTDNGDFTSTRHDAYILVKLQNDTNEEQIYTRMTIKAVREQ